MNTQLYVLTKISLKVPVATAKNVKDVIAWSYVTFLFL